MHAIAIGHGSKAAGRARRSVARPQRHIQWTEVGFRLIRVLTREAAWLRVGIFHTESVA